MSHQQSQGFCLKLNSHQAHVIDQFQKLYNDEQMVDCTLSCNDGSIKAHKLVLSACSPYFTQLFINFTNPYQYPVIILKDMSFADLRVLIEFMYKGEVTVSQNLLPSVLESAKALQITGLREIKVGLNKSKISIDKKKLKNTFLLQIANQERKPADHSTGKPAKRRKRKHKSGEFGDSGTEGSDVQTDNESNDTKQDSSQQLEVNDEVHSGGFLHEQYDDQESIDADQESPNEASPSKSFAGKPTRQQTANLQAAQSRGQLNNSSVSTHKQSLRQLRIEKTAAQTGNLSGRKMWSEEETKHLVRIWEEESARVWASAGKKQLSLQRISDLLGQEKIDRDVSQVEGKIKALKRDFKQIKQDKAIQQVQQRMAPYLDKLEKIFSREQE